MRRAYYVIPLLILFAAMTSGCGETAGPVKSPGVKPGSGRDALVKRTADKNVGNKATASKDTAAKKVRRPLPKRAEEQPKAPVAKQGAIALPPLAEATAPPPAEARTPAATESSLPQIKVPMKAVSKTAVAAAEASEIASINALAEGKATAEALASLSKALKSKSAVVRAHAAHALGVLGPAAKPAVESLAALVTDPDHAVRRRWSGRWRASGPARKFPFLC